MTRIAVIGSSHVGALKQGWDQIATEHPSLDVDFLAMNIVRFRQTELRDDLRFGLPDHMRKDPAHPVQTRRILDLSQYDHVWQVGGWQLLQAPVLNVISEFNVDGFSGTHHQQAMSQAVFEACAQANVQATLPASNWFHWPKGRLWFSAVPRRNERITHTNEYQRMNLRDFKPAWDFVEQMFNTELAQRGIQNIPQPAHTLTDLGFTKRSFGADRVDPKTGSPDVSHMNPAYGVEMWTAFLERAMP